MICAGFFHIDQKMAAVIIQNWARNKFIAPYPVPPTETLHSLKWMPGDCVNEDGRVQKRAIPKLVGIIDIVNRTRFGTNARGIPLYIMYPIDIAYPPFLIAVKTKPDTNIFAIAKYEHWNTGNPWPRACLLNILGPCGDMNIEQEALRHTLPPLPLYTPEAISTLAEDDWDITLHIDPPGCQDIDDILCWKFKDCNCVQVGIGITDVAYWVPEGSPYDTIAKERGATLYKNGVAIEPMLPHELSAGVASLKCDGVARPVICLVFELIRESESGDWRMKDVPIWKQSNMVIKESYTYERIYENPERATQIRDFLGILCGTTLSHDSHEWIERAMILYNKKVAEELQYAGVGILRSHSGNTYEYYAELAAETGCKEIAWLGSSAGEYVVPSENKGHAGLSLAMYTHASSPLRRYVDLVNQRWLKTLKFGASAPSIPSAPMECNRNSKRIRRLERDLHFMECIATSSDELPSAEGFLLTRRNRPGVTMWSTYVPIWKRTVPCILRGLEEGRPGLRIRIRMFLDMRQADWNRRYVYQGLLE
jgi:exoribonuclease R